MQVFLFIGYFLLCCLAILRLNRRGFTGMENWLVLGIFSMKTLASMVNVYLYNHVFPHSDVSFLHWQSVTDLKLLQKNPGAFFQEWLLNWGDVHGKLNFFDSQNAPFWNNLGTLFQGKFMTLCNIFSFGHIYINTIFFNFVFLIGQLFLFKSFLYLQPEKKWLFVMSVFLIPSVLFWCSGIHKDGWILTAFGIIAYSTTQLQARWQFKYVSLLLFALCLLFIVRYFYFLCLIPAYLLWWLTQHKKSIWAWYSGAYLVIGILFFTIGSFFPGIDPMNVIINKQREFMSLTGISDMYLPTLTNTPGSFLSNLPNAIYHIFLIPEFDPSHPLRYNLAAIESLALCVLLLVCLFHLKHRQHTASYYFFNLFFSASLFLFIGYTIPNSGALVRYKSEFLALVFPTMLSLSEIPWLKRFYTSALTTRS